MRETLWGRTSGDSGLECTGILQLEKFRTPACSVDARFDCAPFIAQSEQAILKPIKGTIPVYILIVIKREFRNKHTVSYLD